MWQDTLIAMRLDRAALDRWQAAGIDLDALFAPIVEAEQAFKAALAEAEDDDLTEAQEAALAALQARLMAAMRTVQSVLPQDEEARLFEAAALKWYPDAIGPLGWIVIDEDGTEVGRL